MFHLSLNSSNRITEHSGLMWQFSDHYPDSLGQIKVLERERGEGVREREGVREGVSACVYVLSHVHMCEP